MAEPTSDPVTKPTSAEVGDEAAPAEAAPAEAAPAEAPADPAPAEAPKAKTSVVSVPGDAVLEAPKAKTSVVSVDSEQPQTSDVQALRKSYGGTSAQINKSNTSQAAAAARSKALGTVDAKSLAMGGAGQGGGFGLNAPGYGVKVNHFAGKRNSGGGGFKIDDSIGAAWAQVMDDTDATGWIICEYASDNKSLVLKNKGEGGLTAFKGELGDGLCWGGFRCNAVDKRGGLECKRPKFIFVQYKPESASSIKKAKMGAHKGDVKQVITGAHVDVIVENIPEDLTADALADLLQRATGAHKPNGYEFDEGDFKETDFYGLGIGKDCKGETTSTAKVAS